MSTRVDAQMKGSRVLVAMRVAKPTRRRGFCPACGFGLTGRTELAVDGVTVAIVLAVAVGAWAVTARLMHGADMTMGLGSVSSFVATWTVMMAAMMVPSAIPLIYRFGQQIEGRRGRTGALAALALVYLGIWLIFGVVSYLAYNALGMPWHNQPLVGGVALGLAAIYALTPIKRKSQERCREVCALHGDLPFDLVRAGALAGWRYGLSCLGCSAGLMVAMVLVGMSSMGWTLVLATLVIAYKFAPTKGWRMDLALAGVVAALGLVYAH